MNTASTSKIMTALRARMGDAAYACARDPLIDPGCPDTSDLDVLVFGDVDGLVPERARLPVDGEPALSLDLLHVPVRSMDDLTALAAYGLVTHRLLRSQPIVSRHPFGEAVERVRALANRADLRAQRLRGFLEMGAYTIREVGITWDFPELAILWSAIAQIACAAAMVDASGEFCPNIYTRPLEYLRGLERRTGLALEQRFVGAAHLDADPEAAVTALERMQALVEQRFPEPAWPETMRTGTRAEYRYFAAREELVHRVAAAREMRARGDGAGALFYLRFHAYMLARVPMVARCAREGRDVSFVRPERAVRRVLEQECPELLPDLRAVLGGERGVGVASVMASLETTFACRQRCLAFLSDRGHDLASLPAWEPCRPPPRAV